MAATPAVPTALMDLSTVEKRELMWNGWARPKRGRVWHRVVSDSRDSSVTLVCTGLRFVTRRDVMDYRWSPERGSRCSRCAPDGWVLDETGGR